METRGQLVKLERFGNGGSIVVKRRGQNDGGKAQVYLEELESVLEVTAKTEELSLRAAGAPRPFDRRRLNRIILLK